MALYNSSFFSGHLAGSASSAKTIVPITLDLTGARSVVDIGCGTGAWLREFARAGVNDFLGMDGPWVRQEDLLVPAESFRSADLSSPPACDRTFDLAISLEVAEHLPESAAEGFVSALCRLAPVVLFSAAIPGQGGTGHINEQWPGYWSERFGAAGHKPIDCIRARVWSNPRVQWWYAQNTLVFAKAEAVEKMPNLRAAAERAPDVLPLVHPGCLAVHTGRRPGLSDLLREIPGATRRAVAARVGTRAGSSG